MHDSIPAYDQENIMGKVITTSLTGAGRPFGHRATRVAGVALLVLIALATVFFWRADTTAQPVAAGEQLVDVRGRHVTIPGPVRKIAIDDSRYLVALGLIHPDPVALLAAWPQDVNRLGPETYQQILQQSPQLADLPR